MPFLKQLFKGLEQVAFPPVCLGCSAVFDSRDRFLCESCASERFDDPNPANQPACEAMILPEDVNFQDALWKYDKEGVLQQLIHMLKYEGMAEVGQELGTYGARRVHQRHIGGRIPESEPVLLLPVPLHKKREKKRGYNQAELIAGGMASVLDMEVAEKEVVTRTRHTVTQTRHNFEQRMKNLKNAFKVNSPEVLKGKHILIVDDVFTTGSTCFTLSAEIKKAGPASIGIFTIGMA